MPRVNGVYLWLAEHKKPLVEISEDSTRHRIVEAAIHLALCLHETTEGKASLAQVATQIITLRNQDAKPDHIYHDDLSRMPLWINRFLECMREDFPPVYLAKSDGEGYTKREVWGTNMKDYVAAEAGKLVLNKALIDNMLFARENEARHSYNVFRFQLAITIAHELLHFLTGFLTGYDADWLCLAQSKKRRSWPLLGGIVTKRCGGVLVRPTGSSWSQAMRPPVSFCGW